MPYDFTGVTRAAHLAALAKLYAILDASKVSKVDLILEKFGLDVWAALVDKYPQVRCPVAVMPPRVLLFRSGPCLCPLPLVQTCR
jgi:hypothetical protein